MTQSYPKLDFSNTAAVRFGYGLSPRFAPPLDADALIASLSEPDAAVRQWPSVLPGEGTKILRRFRNVRRDRNRSKTVYRDLRLALRDLKYKGAAVRMARVLDSPVTFRERLHWFWTDHFTTVTKRIEEAGVQLDHHDHAIRPRISGRFYDLLEAAILHPMMLVYLDQSQSTGPTSRAGKKRGVGVNENLAREVMELHTLGVHSSYSQEDVRQLALLFTGMIAAQGTLDFRANAAEPGAETVLRHRYGSGLPSMDDIRKVLGDLARHPDTAHHIARKLAVHFISDDPDLDLVTAMTRTYMDEDTALLPVYNTMVRHPAAQVGVGSKARQPFDWMATALRGMSVTGATLMRMETGPFRRFIFDPMARMGQPWQNPVGPDGWPEETAAWINPPGLAERITWSMTVPVRLMPKLPDPRDLARTIVPGERGDEVANIAFRAERRSDGLALVLASPALNTR